ncbi:SanA/YdcF family protein [Nocardiopsis listeri]|uniref:SanA/YdcF family protein n=1 Tax=Nocardiopsis listeri TaxID=53440 RepID=UPI00082A5531
MTSSENSRTPSPPESTESGAGTVRPARRRLPLVLAAVAVMVLGCVPFVWQLFTTSEHRYDVEDVPERPVALVLGAGVRPDGIPSHLLAQRLELAVELYEVGRIEAVLVSGDNGVEHHGETDTMRDYLIEAGVPADRIVGDHAGFATWDSCVRATEVFGVEEAVVLTQDFHVPRAVGMCRAAGIDAVGVGDNSFGERAMATVYGWMREVPAAVAALGTVLLRPDPTFLGEPESGVEEALARAAEESAAP